MTTDRLLLRPFRIEDAPDVQQLAGDVSVADTALDIPHPFEDGVAEAWISTHAPGYASGTLAAFAVTARESGALLGATGLSIDPEHGRGELGYWIGREFWGHGYATEAARTLMRYGFDGLGLNRIHASHLARNPASGRVLEKLGMRVEGVLREHVRHRGFRGPRHLRACSLGLIMRARSNELPGEARFWRGTSDDGCGQPRFS